MTPSFDPFIPNPIMPRRICDKHGWDGGGDCPWCENEALRKRLAEVKKVAAEQAEGVSHDQPTKG